MRVLVVGTVPPPGGEAAARLAAVAGELLAAGESVEILSPDARSAAHRHARLAGPLLAVELALRARKFDAVVVNFEPGLPLASTADRLTRAITLGALGIALRPYGQVTVRLPSPIPLPGGVGGRATQALWSKATTIVVENEDDRAKMIVAPGVSAERVLIDEPSAAQRPSTAAGWGALDVDDADLRLSVQAMVRARAARDRNVNRARTALGGSTTGGADDPFRGQQDRVSRPAAVDLARLAAGRARRLAHKAARSLRSARA